MFIKNHRFITSLSLLLVTILFTGCAYFDTSGHDGLVASSRDMGLVDTTPVYGEPSMRDVVLRSTNGRVTLYPLDAPYDAGLQGEGIGALARESIQQTPFLDLARSPFVTPEEPSAMFTRPSAASKDSSVEIFSLN